MILLMKSIFLMHFFDYRKEEFLFNLNEVKELVKKMDKSKEFLLQNESK